MPRVKKSLKAKTRHKKVLKATKGHYGARSRLYKTAKQSQIKSLQYAFRDRRNRKRDMRALWISRISAASRAKNVPYSQLINALHKKDILLNRKILSDLAINDASSFEKILETAIS